MSYLKHMYDFFKSMSLERRFHEFLSVRLINPTHIYDKKNIFSWVTQIKIINLTKLICETVTYKFM